MRWILFLSITSALVLYVVLGTESKMDQSQNKDRETKRDDKVEDVFQSENLAKGFIKDKRAPSPGFLFRRKYKIYRRPYGHHGYHGYHGSHYHNRKSREEYEEMEENGFWGK